MYEDRIFDFELRNIILSLYVDKLWRKGEIDDIGERIIKGVKF